MWGWLGLGGVGMVGGIGLGALERCDMLYRVVAGLSRGDGLSVFEQLLEGLAELFLVHEWLLGLLPCPYLYAVAHAYE